MIAYHHDHSRLIKVVRTGIRAWMSLKFGQMRPLVSMATDRVTVGKTASSRFLETLLIRFISYLQVTMLYIRA